MFGTMLPATGNGQPNAAELKRALKPYRGEERKDLLAEAAARYRLATTTDTPFVERLVHFWSNHFAVSIDRRPAGLLGAPIGGLIFSHDDA